MVNPAVVVLEQDELIRNILKLELEICASPH